MVNEYSYDSYGNAEVAVETVLQRFRYTARFFDAETNLYYYRARHYDAGTGRFNQEDPIWFAAGDLNVHRYVWNNPVNWNDPSGLAAAAENRALAAITAGTIAGLRTGVINVARLTASYANRLGLNATGARYFQQTVRHNLDRLAAGTGTLGDLIAVNLGGIAAVLHQVNSDAPDDDAGNDPDDSESTPSGPGAGTPATNPDGWDKLKGSKPPAYVPAGGKEPVLQGDRGNPHGGGDQYKKWKKRRDFNKGKPRDGTVNDQGDRIRD